MIICGILYVAGAYLSAAVQAEFHQGTAWKPFHRCTSIFAKWPWYALGACLLFGLFFTQISVFQHQLQIYIWIMVFLLLGCAASLAIYAVRREDRRE
jgi:simple sugar transport system permease protein